MPKSETFGVLFGRLVREKRGIEGLSQDALALAAGLTKARISELETGKIANPHATTVDAICVALNISREDRSGCYAVPHTTLPKRLLENLALRFGYTNPQASEEDLETFLKNKAEEFREMQTRLAQITSNEGEVAKLLEAANQALEEGEFELADQHLAGAENIQLSSTTAALKRQSELRLARGQAALLAGEIITAIAHWEAAANYFHFLDQDTEAETRCNYCNDLRAYGYRYRSVPALTAAAAALKSNLEIWTRAASHRNWCRVMTALGGTHLRLAQFDNEERYDEHIAAAQAAYAAVRQTCSETVLPYYYAISGGNLANVMAERKLAKSDEDYIRNVEEGLELRLSGLNALDVAKWPEEWGIFQHNTGLSYIQLFQSIPGRCSKTNLIDRAINHLELSFKVRDREAALQYWIASTRSLGEALVEKSLCQAGADASCTLRRAKTLLTEAISRISETDHPHQWAELQEQLARCTEA